ncbi:MAG: PEP-CTERM sorting domain-containing protein [Planctomycetaceae bacterium]|nr:PEP-CTERM sorting domain-containing protein [Planctomycetaceae bacterium]
MIAFAAVLAVAGVTEGAPIPVSSYAPVGSTVLNHTFAPDPDRVKLTDGVFPTGLTYSSAGWVGFGTSVKYVTLDFDLGSVNTVGSVEVYYLCADADLARPSRMRVYGSTDGTFAGTGWGSNSDAGLPTTAADFGVANFPDTYKFGNPSTRSAQDVLLTLTTPLNARYVRVVFDHFTNGTLDGNNLWVGEVGFFQPIPEPATLALLSMGALALIRRRRA